jgi:deazaflavin-dependent oxidoreductase (nitroreductase family)
MSEKESPLLTNRFYAWAEVFLMTKLMPKDRPGAIAKWIFKIPILYYRLGLGGLVGPYFLLLTTTGRKSGLPRQTPLEYDYNAETGTYRIAAGWGGKTDWYRNALANSRVSVQVGRKKFEAEAEPVPHREVAEFMMAVSRRVPAMDAVWQRWSDKPVDGTLISYMHAAQFFPSLRLKPIEVPDKETP